MSVSRRGANDNGDEVSAAMAHWLADLFVAPQSVEAVAGYRLPSGMELLAAMGDEARCAAGMDKMRSALRAGVSAAAVARDLSMTYTLLFEGVAGPATVSLYESTYTGAFNRLYQQPVDDMELLLQRSGLSISKDCCESPDHLSIELALLSAVVRAGDSAGVVLVRDQLLRWLPQFAAACGQFDQTGFYSGAAMAVNEFLMPLVFPEAAQRRAVRIGNLRDNEVLMPIPNRQSGVSRRSFLKSALASGALGIPGISLLAAGARAAPVANREVLTGCHWGAFRAQVENGRMTAVKPWELDPHPTPQLAGVLDSVYSPTRIKYPMVRRAFLEHGAGADPDGRGGGDFVRVSWKQALDLVAGELQRVKKTYGPAAIFAGSYGWKSPGKLHNCQTLLRRMMTLNGGFVNTSGDYSTGAAQVVLPYVIGSIGVYEQPTAWPVVAANTDLMVFWGADPINNCQISYQVADHGAYPGLEALKKSGKTVICIDPLKTETCTFLGAEWLAPRPQTDVAMMLGIAHTLYTEKLHDEKFLAKYTTGFEQFLPYLTGKTDGVAKSAEWASQICDIPAATIKDLARRFAKGRTMLACGYSLQRQHHGEQPHWMIVTLACMLGQIGTPGGGFGLSYHYASGGNPAATTPVLTGIGDGSQATAGADWLSKSGSASIPVSRMVEMLLNPGKPFDFNGTKGTYPDVKLAYWTGGNPFAHQQDRNQMLKAWRKLETFIVHDFQWTATARRADIVLPATTAFERNDIEQVGDYALTHILAMKQVIEPVFEARNDYDIFADIAERLGKREQFTEGKTEMDWIRSFYEAGRVAARGKSIEMPIFDAFWNSDNALAFPIDDAAKAYVQYKDFRDDPLLNALGTPSGRFEIFSKNIEKMHYDDCPPHPTWMEPAERLGGHNTKYPLHVDSKHPKYRLHSQLCGTKLRSLYAIAGREPCLMNTKDAAQRDVKDGDVIRVFNDRGQILSGVKLTDDIRPGVIVISEGGWFDPVDPRTPGSLCRYGDVNNLSLGIGTSKLAQGNCGHTAVAQVEKYRGEAPATHVFDTPSGA